MMYGHVFDAERKLKKKEIALSRVRGLRDE
jgi:hypothetical protein